MNEVQNLDEPLRNLLNIWVFEKGGNILGFGEKGRKNYGTKVVGCNLHDIMKSSLSS
jgi:hypothetical protein